MAPHKDKSSFGIGLTATRSTLLPARSDHTLRRVIYHLFTISSRMEELRRLLGRPIGISGPQFSLLMAIAELSGSHGVSVGELAGYLHVSGPFVTAESRKLAGKGYIEKAADPSDLRVSRVRLSAKG